MSGRAVLIVADPLARRALAAARALQSDGWRAGLAAAVRSGAVLSRAVGATPVTVAPVPAGEPPAAPTKRLSTGAAVPEQLVVRRALLGNWLGAGRSARGLRFHLVSRPAGPVSIRAGVIFRGSRRVVALARAASARMVVTVRR